MIPTKITGALRKGHQMSKPVHCKGCGKMLKTTKGKRGRMMPEVCGGCRAK